MSKATFTWDGQLIKNVRPPHVIGHYAITLMVMDSDDPKSAIEYYPRIPVEGIFEDKNATEPIDINKIFAHVSTRDRALLDNDPLVGGLICLDENGYVPVEYIDKRSYIIYYEYENCQDMIRHNVYDATKNHGRLVLVRDAQDDYVHPTVVHGPHWAIYSLRGNNPRDLASWERAFYEPQAKKLYHWDQIDKELRCAVIEIDMMVKASHDHADKELLDHLKEIGGRLHFRGEPIMFRKDYSTLFMDITEEELGRMRGNDTAALISEERTYPNPKPAFQDVLEGKDTVAHLFENNGEISSIEWINVGGFEDFTSFARNCYNLKSVTSLDYSNAVLLTEAFAQCPLLERFYDIEVPNATHMNNMFYNDKSLVSIGAINHSEKLHYIIGAFQDCIKLKNLPVMDYYKIPYISYFAAGCESITTIDVSFKPITMNWAFARCKSLESIKTLNMTRCTSARNAFTGCSSLREVAITPGTLRVNISFKGTALSLECALGILHDLPVVNTEKQIDFRGTPAMYVSADEIHNAADKGWKVITY